jgi:tetrahydromethanopterin S-methyltransferase subunit E
MKLFKVLAVIGIIISLVGLGVGVYCQLEIVPWCEEGISESLSNEMFMYYHDMKMILGTVSMAVGFLGSLVGVISAVKKAKIGWIALIPGLVAIILGLMQSTHMFDF